MGTEGIRWEAVCCLFCSCYPDLVTSLALAAPTNYMTREQSMKTAARSKKETNFEQSADFTKQVSERKALVGYYGISTENKRMLSKLIQPLLLRRYGVFQQKKSIWQFRTSKNEFPLSPPSFLRSISALLAYVARGAIYLLEPESSLRISRERICRQLHLTLSTNF